MALGAFDRVMREAQKLQARMARIQQELGEERVEGSSGGGAVKVVCDGHQRVLEVRISPEVVDPDDVEMLEDLVLSAVRDAQERSRRLAEEKLGGIGLPGMPF